MLNQEDYDTALDYLASGLKEQPLNIQLLYNYAVYSLKRLKHQQAIKFFDFCMQIRPRWADALFG